MVLYHGIQLLSHFADGQKSGYFPRRRDITTTEITPRATCQFLSECISFELSFCTHVNVQESMGKPCKYMQFIKHAFVTHSTAFECMRNEIEGSYDKTIIITVPSYTGKMSLVCCCCIVTHVAHLYNRDSIKFTIMVLQYYSLNT